MDTYNAMITEWNKFCKANSFGNVFPDVLLSMNILTDDQIKYTSAYLRRWRQMGF